METLFILIQSLAAISGALIVLVARQPQRAFWGFGLVVLACTALLFYQQGPWPLALFLFGGFGTITSWIYIKGSRRLEKEASRPREKHLGISRSLLLLLSMYFLFSILPLWPTLLSEIRQASFSSQIQDPWTWVCCLMAVFLLCFVGLLPLIHDTGEQE